MDSITILKRTLTDGSAVYDLKITDEYGGCIFINLPYSSEDEVNARVNKFHEAFEALTGTCVGWGDMLHRRSL